MFEDDDDTVFLMDLDWMLEEEEEDYILASKALPVLVEYYLSVGLGLFLLHLLAFCFVVLISGKSFHRFKMNVLVTIVLLAVVIVFVFCSIFFIKTGSLFIVITMIIRMIMGGVVKQLGDAILKNLISFRPADGWKPTFLDYFLMITGSGIVVSLCIWAAVMFAPTEHSAPTCGDKAPSGAPLPPNQILVDVNLLKTVYLPLTSWLSDNALKNKIDKAELGPQLQNIPMLLLSEERQEKTMSPNGENTYTSHITLQVNPTHQVIIELLHRVTENVNDYTAKETANFLFENAILTSSTESLPSNSYFINPTPAIKMTGSGHSLETNIEHEASRIKKPVDKDDL